MKSVQGDSGHARMDMVADVYSHIIDEDRRYNAQKFEEQFYNAKGLKNAEEGKTAPMPKFETRLNSLTQWQRFKKRAKLKKKSLLRTVQMKTPPCSQNCYQIRKQQHY